MLAMARATMLNPEVILLDEPSMGLAPILVDEVFRIIGRLKDSGVTMLLVEQFAAAALASGLAFDVGVGSTMALAATSLLRVKR